MDPQHCECYVLESVVVVFYNPLRSVGFLTLESNYFVGLKLKTLSLGQHLTVQFSSLSFFGLKLETLPFGQHLTVQLSFLIFRWSLSQLCMVRQ